jgi:hypothetical protein
MYAGTPSWNFLTNDGIPLFVKEFLLKCRNSIIPEGLPLKMKKFLYL